MEKLSTNLLQYLDKFPFSPLTLLPLLIFLIFLCKWLFSNNNNRNKLPPSPPKLPIIGNLHQLGRLPHRSLWSLSRRYGDLMLLHIGSKPTLVVSSASAAQEIMKTHDVIFANRPKLTVVRKILYDCKDLGFASYGEYWRQLKSICVLHMFSNKKVRSFRCLREEEAAEVIETIKRLSPLEEPVNLSEIFNGLTNAVVCRAAFGRKYTGENGSFNVRDLLTDFSEVVGMFSMRDFIPWLGWIDRVSGLDAKADKVAMALDDFVEKRVKEHQDRLNRPSDDDDEAGEGEKLQDFTDTLLEIQQDNSSTFTRESVKALLLDMFAAGTATTYALLELAMTELLRHPRALKELQKEVRGISEVKARVDEDDLEDMKYLKAVIKETLRLHPPLPLLLFRESSEDVKINGYNIAAGTVVIVNAWAIQRDPVFWEEPEEFWPERFLNSSVDFKGQDFHFIPFGAGRRGCPGTLFGTVQAELVLANLVSKFDWKLPGGVEEETQEVAENSGNSVHRLHPLMVIPMPYSCK